MRTVLKKLPPDKGGRPKVFTPDKAKAASLEMATLLFQGVDKVDACKRVAQRHGVSVWTMNRYWREYQEANRFRQNVLPSPTMGRTEEKKEAKRKRKTNC
jgi:transposase-like protein